MTISFENTYTPLPKSLTIKNSNTHGLGIFAVEDIDAGINLGLCRIFVKDEWIRTPLGGFINHSENPNCITVIKTGQSSFTMHGQEANLFTKTRIMMGDEILLKYSMSEYQPMP
jgi:hypothetical protein